MLQSRGKLNKNTGKFEFVCQRDEDLQFIYNNIKLEIKDHNYANIETGFISRTLVNRYFHHRVTSLHFLIDGEAELNCGTRITLKAGDVFLIGQNVKCDWIYTKPSREITFSFNMYLCNLDDLFETYDKPVILSEQFDEVSTAEQLFLQESPLGVLKLHNLCMKYMITFLAQSNFDFCRHIELTKKYSKVFNYITDNLSINLSIKDIASNTNYSISFFTKKFVKDNGMTVKEYIHSKVMAEVEQRLITTDESLSQIADAFHFCELAYFTRWFKKHKNCTPSQYRKDMRLLRQNVDGDSCGC